MTADTAAPSRLCRTIETVAGGERVHALEPPPLPPDPPVDLARLAPALDAANRAIGRLDGAASVLPGTSLFLYMYVRKEALLSSQIEGTQSSLSDLLLFEADEAPGAPLDDVVEVSNYVAAMDYGLQRLRAEFPLSARLLREMHARLLTRGRGASRQPGEFRRTQNWLGGTRPGNAVFVPPPADRVAGLMSDLERFFHEPTPGLPPLIRAGLVHLQFETIHPFLDGNGRLGRLLITLLLCAEDVLREPILYLSLFFKTHRSLYYQHLQQVRERGSWEEWLAFFLEGVAETSRQAADTARELLDLFATDRRRIEALGRPAASALRVHERLQQRPITAIPEAARDLGLSAPTVSKSLGHLERLGVVREITGKQRRRRYVYGAYLDILARGTEPLPR